MIGSIMPVAISSAATLFGVVLTLVIQHQLTKRQQINAERNMYLSLIDRRSTWYDRAVDLWKQWIEHQVDIVESVISGKAPDTSSAMRDLAEIRREAQWLFGPKVVEEIDRLEQSIGTYGSARMEMRQIGLLNPNERLAYKIDETQDRFSKCVQAMYDQQALTLAAVSEYLYVGDIKPKSYGR